MELLDCNHEERTEMWYTKRELSQMEEERQRLAEGLQQRKKTGDNKNDRSLGFDDIAALNETRATQRATAIRLILEQQEVNRLLGVDDPIGIAQISATLTMAAKDEALISAEAIAEIKTNCYIDRLTQFRYNQRSRSWSPRRVGHELVDIQVDSEMMRLIILRTGTNASCYSGE